MHGILFTLLNFIKPVMYHRYMAGAIDQNCYYIELSWRDHQYSFAIIILILLNNERFSCHL